jgi:hypothetical protein
MNSTVSSLILRRSIDLLRSREAGDPALLARRLGIELDIWQIDALRARARQTILLCSRQSGKSTVSAIAAAHEAVYNAPALVLELSPSLRQSIELHRKTKSVLSTMLEEPDIDAESSLRIELANGSRIVCLPGKEQTIRGFSGVNLLVVDEAARVSDDLYQAIRPMLAVSGGRIILLSTPYGEQGFFHETWRNGENWHRVKVTAPECSRISTEWLEEERRQIGEFWFSQEYLCEFKGRLDQEFDSELLEMAWDPNARTLGWNDDETEPDDRR